MPIVSSLYTDVHVGIWMYLNSILALMAPLVVKGYHNRNIMLVAYLCLIIFHCSLRSNDLTAAGAIALAKALQRNWSLEEL